MQIDDWNIDGAQWQSPQKSITDTDESVSKRSSDRRQTECYEISSSYLYRRAFGETQLFDVLGTDGLKEGVSYHILTGGNVDSLSFLRYILRYHSLDYLLFSTWCMAAEDILQFREWMDDSRIKKMDAYVGEIFPNTYRVEWQMLNRLFDEKKCGRIICFRNHSKIYAGWGGNFYFSVESSANINTNPRQENTVITVDKGLTLFYKDCFDKIR